jgi:uncharacterized repeat protein (TIGR04052 family)
MLMKLSRFGRLSVTLSSLALAAAACSDDDANANEHEHSHDASADAASVDAGGKRQPTEIVFEARVGEDLFDCAETYELGTAKTAVKPLDFKLYVHGVQLVTTSGEAVDLTLEQDGKWQYQDVALLDFEDDSGTCSNGTAAVNTKIVGSVPAGTYKGLKLKLGVPEALNHQNQAKAESPLNIEGMFWSWLTGYKFLRIDVMPAHAMMAQQAAAEDAGPGHAGAAMGFLVHLGSTMCTGNAMTDEGVDCKRSNRPEASFASFDPSKQKIVVNLATLLEGSEVSMNMGGQPGCMSAPDDPECEAIFEQLGVDLGTGASSGTPKFLSVADR